MATDAPLERPSPPAPYPRPTYEKLSDSGFFAAVAASNGTPEPALRSGAAVLFTPTYKLWSDGASKRRWISLPPGSQINSADMDHWIFPVGTRFWKEFSRGGVPLETRLIERYGTGPEDYWMGSFVWMDDQSDALFVVDGQSDIAGTTHDAPSQKDCGSCHRGEPGRILGFSAVQMPSSAAAPDTAAVQGPSLQDLNAAGLLTRAADEAGYPAPGAGDTAQALGYLHANCGHCHNENGASWPDTQMVLRLVVGEREAATCGVYRSIVDGKLQYWRGGAIKLRVAAGNPDGSAIVARMSTRGSDNQMPPLATEEVDTDGVDLLRGWVTSLGAPAP